MTKDILVSLLILGVMFGVSWWGTNQDIKAKLESAREEREKTRQFLKDKKKDTL